MSSVLFRPKIFLLPLQTSFNDVGFHRLFPLLNSLLDVKLTAFHEFDYKTGDWYIIPENLENVRTTIESKLDLNFLEAVKKRYLREVAKLNRHIKSNKIKNFHDVHSDFANFFKFPLLTKFLPEIIIAKMQEHNPVDPDILREIIRLPENPNMNFYFGALEFGLLMAKHPKILSAIQKEKYEEILELVLENDEMKYNFNMFMDKFFAFGPRRWDIVGFEDPLNAIKMICKSCVDADKNKIAADLDKRTKANLQHKQLLKKYSSRLSAEQKKYLKYLWFFENNLERETHIQRAIFYRSVLPSLAKISKDFVKDNKIENEIDVLFLTLDEILQNNISKQGVSARKEQYFSIAKENDGNIDYFYNYL